MTISNWRGFWTWLLLWALVAGLGAGWLAHARLVTLENAFATDARIVHRLLSQRVVQHDAVMAMLPLLHPPADKPDTSDRAIMALPHLTTTYPQIEAVVRRPPEGQWPNSWPEALRQALDKAVVRSRNSDRAELALADMPAGKVWLALADHSRDQQNDHGLRLDLQTTIPWSEWPMDTSTSPVRVRLEYQDQAYIVQTGQRLKRGRQYTFRKELASLSQPFDVVLERDVGWQELPWITMLAWASFSAAVLAALNALLRQRVAARRAEELLHLGQVARLNQLGELAAGLAHELNQPLTAVLANTQAAQRLLDEEEPDLATAHHAMGQAVNQARRASEVVGRLRRVVERPDLSGQAQPLALADAVHDALHLLEPEIRRCRIAVQVEAPGHLPAVRAEPVALQQIIYNLVMNALQAMEQTEQDPRRLLLSLRPHGTQVLLSVRDTGPGVAPEARAQLFTPFYTTRAGGLGLGLSLSQSLAQAMGGDLTLAPAAPLSSTIPPTRATGTEFHLLLAIADTQ